MAEKILNTRIQLKYGTLSEWQQGKYNKSEKLKKGEIAIVTLGPDVETNHPTDATNTHPILFKVGTEEHYFDALPWASALAADVYDWAKKASPDWNDFSEIPGAKIGFNVKAEGSGNAVTAATWDASTKTLTLTKGETFATKKELDDAILAINNITGELKNLNTTNKTNLVAAINEALQAVEVGGTGSVVTVVKDTTSKGSVATYTVKQGGNAVGDKIEIPEMIIASGSTDGSISVNGTDITVKGLGSLAFEDSLDKTDIGLGDVDNTSDANKPVSTAQAQAIADALAAAQKYADDNDTNTEYHVEYDSTNKKIKLVAGADASKMEIDATAFIKDGMVNNVEIKDGNLVITFNTDAGKDAIEVPLKSLVDVYTGVDGTTVKVEVSSTNAISAEVKTNSIKDGHIASDAAIAKSKLAPDVQTSLGLADTALQSHQSLEHLATKEALQAVVSGTTPVAKATDADKLGGVEAVKYLTKTDAESTYRTEAQVKSAIENHAGIDKVGTVVSITAGDGLDGGIITETGTIALNKATKDSLALADSALQKADIATGSVNGTISVEGANVAVKGLGSAAYTDSTIYATAEQGSKADSAIQSVTSVAGNGIKVTTSGTTVTIDWDSGVTLVFNCGGAND